MDKIIRNGEYMPHQAIVFTRKNFLKDFSLQKVKCAYDMRSNYIGNDPAIWEIEFHPTNLCNLNCSGCSYGTRHNKKSLTFEQVVSIIDKYKEYDLKSVFFSGGGDPLLWKYWDDFFERIEKTCSYGIATNMFNFSSIKNHWHLFDFYQIHVTGFDEKTSKITTGVDSFRETNRNIYFLLNHRLSSQNIALKILINADNYVYLPQFLNYVKIFRADSIVLKYQQDFLINRNLANNHVLDSIRQMAYSHKIFSEYDFLLDNLDDVIFHTLPCPEKCLFATSGLYRLINADGEIYPCIASNANKKSIELNTKFFDMYSQDMREGICPLKACRHYRFSQYLFNNKNKFIPLKNELISSLL